MSLNLIGQKFIDFTSSAVAGNGEIIEDFSFSQAIDGKAALLFFYPLDFTFVCPSELIALDKRMQSFREKNIEVFSVSVDSHFSHAAWRKTPINKGGIGEVSYTMLADLDHNIANSYGVMAAGGKVALRASILIDAQGVIQSQLINNLPIGRDVDEIIRIFDAIAFHAEYGEVCPAGWSKGKSGMKASPAGVAEFLSEHSESL